MTKPLAAKDVLLHPDAQSDLAGLDASSDKTDATNRDKARALRRVLLKDALHGEVVKKASIPRSLKGRYDLDNLYVEDLADFWRLLYTIRKDGQARYVIVLRIVDHAAYRKWFAGRRR